MFVFTQVALQNTLFCNLNYTHPMFDFFFVFPENHWFSWSTTQKEIYEKRRQTLDGYRKITNQAGHPNNKSAGSYMK